MNLYYITHLRADTVHGVHVIDPVDYPDADWHYCVEDFLHDLKTLRDGESVFFSANPNDLEKITTEYGISR